ncbi:hypothetical protein ABZ330_15405 [Streptomyces sp. NPDC006172]|uniref:hypothetical protein n=1 Tax=Streptomyces sp. NPDC006172 TaxID=3154470 RepID=UPI0033DCE71B
MEAYDSGLHAWLRQYVVATERLPLFSFLVGLLTAFVGIRISVRLIRAKTRWWPGNVRWGGLHIHHAVFGVVFMVVAGIAGLATPDEAAGRRIVAALVFGIGTGLVLDEFALILYLEDVYWTERGRTSIDAIFAAVALSAMVLMGLHPLGLAGWGPVGAEANGACFVVVVVGSLLLAVVTLLKGKSWTGLVGVFCPPLLVVGALRLSRPQAPWARWWYSSRRPDKQERADVRERRLRAPLMAAKVRVQELFAGRHDLPDTREKPARSAVPCSACPHRVARPRGPAEVSAGGTVLGFARETRFPQ